MESTALAFNPGFLFESGRRRRTYLPPFGTFRQRAIRTVRAQGRQPPIAMSRIAASPTFVEPMVPYKNHPRHCRGVFEPSRCPEGVLRELAMDPYRQVVLAARPRGLPRADDFRLETGSMPEPLEGQVLVATKVLSLDPYMRGRMNDAESYAPPVNVGGVMEGEVVAEVVRSRHPSFCRGELVQGRIGWRTHAAVAPRHLRRVATGLNPPETSLGVLGMPGFTAYVGLRAIGQPKPGETVDVSSAAGAVGSVVGQLAQLAGARAVGIAGGAAKCAYVRDELR